MSTSNRYSLVRGFRDIYPGDSENYTYVSESVIRVLRSYGYEEIKLPLVERTELFTRGIGEATDMVEKEMYSFDDRDGVSLSLRPEGTASCVRAAIGRNIFRGARPKLWYSGPMFRYERPQKGRYRQFEQIGVEAFGYPGPGIDAELIVMLNDVIQELDLGTVAELEINTLLGSSESRTLYKQALVDYLIPFKTELDEDSQRRIFSNPLRILDTKDERTQKILEVAPAISEYLNDSDRLMFDELIGRLDRSGVKYRINGKLVRGLDYYTHSVFEWLTDQLGAQRQLAAGGRYDDLVERLGGPPTPAVGFSIGVDRMVLLREKQGHAKPYSAADVYVIFLDETSEGFARNAARTIRSNTHLRVREHHGDGKLKRQMRDADRSGARWAVIVGESEKASDSVSVKCLRESRDQCVVPISELAQYFQSKEVFLND